MVGIRTLIFNTIAHVNIYHMIATLMAMVLLGITCAKSCLNG